MCLRLDSYVHHASRRSIISIPRLWNLAINWNHGDELVRYFVLVLELALTLIYICESFYIFFEFDVSQLQTTSSQTTNHGVYTALTKLCTISGCDLEGEGRFSDNWFYILPLIIHTLHPRRPKGFPTRFTNKSDPVYNRTP